MSNDQRDTPRGEPGQWGTRGQRASFRDGGAGEHTTVNSRYGSPHGGASAAAKGTTPAKATTPSKATKAPKKGFQPNSPGRNVPVAIAVGILMGAIVIACLIIPGAWYPFVSVVASLGTWEVCRRLSEHGYVLPVPLILLGGLGIIWASYWFGGAGAAGAFILVCGLVMFIRLFRYTGKLNYLRDVSMSIFVLMWISLCGSCAAMLSISPEGDIPGWRVIVTFMLGVIANDVGGFVAGVLFGKHPMAPTVSPKKSWEGFLGSALSGMIVGVLCTWMFLDWPPLVGLVLGMGLVFAATMGDLMESQFKRELGIKDMSRMIPGHGGMMDRLDGMLPAAAMTWIVVTVMTSVGV